MLVVEEELLGQVLQIHQVEMVVVEKDHKGKVLVQLPKLAQVVVEVENLEEIKLEVQVEVVLLFYDLQQVEMDILKQVEL